MRFCRIILTSLILGYCSCSVAQNTIERSVEYAPEIPDTMYVTYQGLSNSSKKDLEIYLKVTAKDTPFEIYSVELQMFDSVLHPLEPFALTEDVHEASDSIVTWMCILRFPYKAEFSGGDTWIVETSEGRFYGAMHFIPKQIHIQESLKSKISKPLVAAICIFVAVTVIFIFFASRKNKRKRSDGRWQTQQEFQSKDCVAGELRNMVDALYADRWNIFNKLCGEYFEKRDAESENVRLSVYRELERQIEELRRAKSLAGLEKQIDLYSDNLMQRLKEQLPGLTKKELVFLTYIYSGFSPRAICLLSDIKIKNFYNKRTRLKDKILGSGAPDCKEFASKM